LVNEARKGLGYLDNISDLTDMEQSFHSPPVIKTDFPGSLSGLRESGILRGPLSWYSGTDNVERSAVSANAQSTDHRTRVEAVRERQISAAVAIKTTLSQRLQLSDVQVRE
jgi:hypothetical protein